MLSTGRSQMHFHGQLEEGQAYAKSIIIAIIRHISLHNYMAVNAGISNGSFCPNTGAHVYAKNGPKRNPFNYAFNVSRFFKRLTLR